MLEEIWAVAHERHAFLEDYSVYGLPGHQGDGQRAARIDGQGLAEALTLHPLARPVNPTTVGATSTWSSPTPCCTTTANGEPGSLMFDACRYSRSCWRQDAYSSKSSAVSSHGMLRSACSASSPVGMAGAAWNHTTVRAE